MFHTLGGSVSAPLTRAIVVLALIAVATMGEPRTSHAIALNIGGVAIADGGAQDLDGVANNSITFNSAAAGMAGFVVPQGYTVSGRAEPVVRPGFNWVTLTNFTCTRPGAGAAGGAMPINVSHTFINLPAQQAIIRWFGSHTNPAGLKGATSTAIGRVNGVVLPGGVAGVLTAGPDNAGVVANFVRNAGPLNVAAGNWNIVFDLTIDLGPGDSANFPNSFDIGNVDLVGVSVPAASAWQMALLAVSLLGLGSALALRFSQRLA